MEETDGFDGFAARLARDTRADHERAENHPFVHALLGGSLSLAAYTELLAQLHTVYTELERGVEILATHPVVRRFAHPELVRLPSIEADLDLLAGSDWRATRAAVLPATERYRDRLRELVTTWPDGLVAHHYTRYLGDLSGGRVIQRMLQRHYGVEGDRGTRLYVFEGIPAPKPFKDTYRKALDEAPWNAHVRDRIVEETALAYRLNADIFTDVERRLATLA